MSLARALLESGFEVGSRHPLEDEISILAPRIAPILAEAIEAAWAAGYFGGEPATGLVAFGRIIERHEREELRLSLAAADRSAPSDGELVFQRLHDRRMDRLRRRRAAGPRATLLRRVAGEFFLRAGLVPDEERRRHLRRIAARLRKIASEVDQSRGGDPAEG